MGVYSLDQASPKKAHAGQYRQPRFSELRRRLTHRRYICLWVLLTFASFYVLRQIYSYQVPTTQSTAHGRRPAGEVGTTTTTTTTASAQSKPTDVKAFGKEVLEEQASSIKPAQYDSIPPPLPKTISNTTGNSLNLKLTDNFEDDEDFGVPEDNEREEEQSWRAPPTSSAKPKLQRSSK